MWCCGQALRADHEGFCGAVGLKPQFHSEGNTAMTKNEPTQSKIKRKNLILSFAIPFVVVGGIWTVWDYCDISDGLKKGRGGPQPTITDQQIFLDSFKESFVLALPAGLIGLGCGLVVFGRSDKSAQKP